MPAVKDTLNEKGLMLWRAVITIATSKRRHVAAGNQMPVFIGGAELNVATALAKWEVPVKYCTALPDNIISKDITAYHEQKISTHLPSFIQANGSGCIIYSLVLI